MHNKNKYWASSLQEAEKIQDYLSKCIAKAVPFDNYNIFSKKKTQTIYIAAVDAAYFYYKKREKITAAGVVYKLNKTGLKQIEEKIYITDAEFPYIAGFLSFREGKALVKVIEKFTYKPDVILVDGQGIAHPKYLGIATHIGIVLDIPTIGCAKSLLTGGYLEPTKYAPAYSFIYNKAGKLIGAAVRTRPNTKVIFISPGYKISIKDSIKLVLKCIDIKRSRLPIPLRTAHMLSQKTVITYKSGEIL